MGLILDVNWLAIIVASVVSFVIGWIWYGPLFGKTWMKYMNIKQGEVNAAKKKGMGKMMVLNFIGTVITAFVLDALLGAISVNGLGQAVQLAFWLWLGFLASTTLLGSVLWENKPWGLFVLNGAYWLVTFVVMAGVLSYWA